MNPISFAKNLLTRVKGRNPLEVAKFLELELLGKHASSYCLHHPSHTLIELTTRCNLRCGYCNQSDKTWQKEFGHQDMPFEMYQKIVPQLKGSKVLLLYNIGEPLLYKEIYQAIALAKKFIPDVRLTSNGLLWTPEVAKKLQEAGLTQMNVSIDSPDPEVMQRNRGADLSVIEENIRQFGGSCNIPVETWSVINNIDAGSLERLPEWASQFPAIKSLYFQLQNGVDSCNEAGIPALISPERFAELQSRVAERCAYFGLKTNIAAIPFYADGYHQRQAKGICKAPFTQLVAINVKGELAPCCSFATHGLGNVAELGFKSTWNGNAMREWRKDMLNENYCEYCSNWCGYKQSKSITSIPIKLEVR